MKKIGYKEAVRKVAGRLHGEVGKALAMNGGVEALLRGALAIEVAENRAKAGASAVALLFDVDLPKVDRDVAEEFDRLMREE